MDRGFSGSGFPAACAIAASLIASWPIQAMAQQIEVAALTECLVANTTDEHIAAMKRLMIAALNDDLEALKSQATNYGMVIITMAMTKCGVSETQLTAPALSEAVGRYGEKLGEKIMTDAFAKIGQ